MHSLKRLQSRRPYERSMFVVVAIATSLRLILIYFNWPVTNSDEGNMGLVALHVAYRGDHPTFFYGLPYLGPLEGYAAAPLFHLFGASVFTLRLPLLLFFAVFLLGMYYLVRLLYSEPFALVTVILLSLGSDSILFLQLKAVGEYPEMLLFAVLICLFAVWLALSSHRLSQELTHAERRKRLVLYGCLGLTIGLALWVDFLILPFVVGAGLLLLLFCRRELLRWPALTLLLGIIVGMFPLLYYNLNAPPNQDSWHTLLLLHHGGITEVVAQHLTWLHQLSGTITIALPLATGANANCPIQAFPPFGLPTPITLPCVLFQGGWGIGYLILWCIATSLVLCTLWQYRRHILSGVPYETSFEEHQETIRQCGRLVLLISAGMTLVLYAVSPRSAAYPTTAFRYLTCMVLALPALLWPLWQGLHLQKLSPNRSAIGAFLVKGGLLLLVAITFMSGMVQTFTEIPEAQAAYQSEQALTQDLLHIGATRIYSEYWTCNRLTFRSREQIICSSLDEQLNPGFDRYLPYRFIVQAAHHPAYVFPLHSPQAERLKHWIPLAAPHYRQYIFESYVVYLVT